MDYVILLWHSLSLPYNYFESNVLSYNTNNAFSLCHESVTCTLWKVGIFYLALFPNKMSVYVSLVYDVKSNLQLGEKSPILCM